MNLTRGSRTSRSPTDSEDDGKRWASFSRSVASGLASRLTTLSLIVHSSFMCTVRSTLEEEMG